MIDSKNLKVTTNCEDCVFALSGTDEKGITTQTGCSFNRLEKFKEQELAEWDDEYGYYVINTVCNIKRDREWANNADAKCDCDECKEDETCAYKVEQLQLERAATKECQVQNDFIILSYNEENTSARLMQSVKQCMKQTILPKILILVTNAKSIPGLKDLYQDLNQVIDGAMGFFFVRITDLERDEYECVDSAFPRVKSTYYTVWKTGQEIPTDYNQKFNDLINVHMKKVSMMIPANDPLHGFTVQSILHKTFCGNRGAPLSEKLTVTAKEQGVESMVINYE
jgi:hypothetical protein